MEPIIWWHYLIGYGLWFWIADQLIFRLIKRLWMVLGWNPNIIEDDARTHEELPRMVGVLERFLYAISWQLEKPEFIGVWLVLKVAGKWKHWTEPRKLGGQVVSGRSTFNVFLIGNGFSVAYGVLAVFLVKWLEDGLFIQFSWVPLLLIVGTLGFQSWARRQIPKTDKK